MHYLKLGRSRAILTLFAASTLLFLVFPGVDIFISRLFFNQGFYLSRQWWTMFMHDSMGYFLGISLASVVALYLWNKLTKRTVCGVDGKRIAYLFLVLILGAGVIVNVALKDNFGRARPRDIVEFGGAGHYTPPFVMSGQCTRNCSFSSGEAAGGFFSLALALALSRRRRVFAAAVAVGAVVSFCRIASGAHFLSDTVVSFFVMLIVADVLHHYLVLGAFEREARLRLESEVLPALPSATET
jgi:lipid A 4'-phosphatase